MNLEEKGEYLKRIDGGDGLMERRGRRAEEAIGIEVGADAAHEKANGDGHEKPGAARRRRRSASHQRAIPPGSHRREREA